ncbi:MAG TPA: hypothetical protein VMZ28_17550 [Kofleriaceae bacterium]|nr:hypothetical protein [Kofleriaceae bacterium]
MKRLVLLVALCACGGGGGGGGGGDDDDPGAPDAAAEEAVCQLPEGPTYLLTSLGIAPGDEGFDLDGDDVVDNSFGDFPFLTRLAVNAGYQDSLDAGEWVVGTLQDEWSEPPVADDADTGLHILTLVDADVPDDVSNDRSGGSFWASPLFLDLDCQSTSRTPGAIEDGLFTGQRDRLDFPLNTGTGSVEMVNLHIEMQYSEDFTTAAGRFGSYLTMCSLSAVPLPLPGNDGGSVLDYIANNDLADAVDGDLDGDGLEQVVGDGTGILQCVDGDGTIIEGSDCPCYPEIADAFSSTVSFEVLQVPVLGLQE